ncbi:tyrosine-type recombinase/integrase [Methylobacterium sp. WL120]|uniref:tyrosine-type recombinase/integrase n=1 Tax=Methylobacterium sp. WL120 TaxID=2603887 RepID=UPI0011C80742|nr:tyrosine-type recombinase/integrase [Methylobacterium sp. WL120]TXM69598.1 tyrosine-type recombinase/integrase [Methylobacterium sp. WL120]
MPDTGNLSRATWARRSKAAPLRCCAAQRVDRPPQREGRIRSLPEGLAEGDGRMMKIAGLKRFHDKRDGVTYNYHRKSGIRILAPFGTAEFALEFDRIDQAHKAKASVRGTLGHLFDEYRKTPEFKNLKPVTKEDYERVMVWCHRLRPMPTARMDSALVTGLRNRAFDEHKRRFANYVVQVISRVFNVGKGLGLTTINPATSVDKIRKPTGERHRNRPWTSAEREAMLEAAPIQLKAPLAFMRYLGARLGDVRRMENSSYEDGMISFVTGKGDVEVTVPCPEPLAEILDQRLPHPKFMFVSTDGPWTEGGWNASFRKLRARLELAGKVKPGLTAHGLRHSVATDLREIGKTDREIADILGQRTTYATPTYHRTADMKRSNAKVLADLHGSGKGRSKQTAEPELA